jgi:type III restriction enzyme
VDWNALAPIRLDASQIPPEVAIKHLLPAAAGGLTLSGPGKAETVTLDAYRKDRSVQELAFHLSRALTRRYQSEGGETAPPHVLFPQILRMAERYIAEKIEPGPGTQRIDAFLSPHYGWVIERLVEAIRPDAESGEAPELPVFEKNRKAGSTEDVSFWTSRDVREVMRSHVNLVVADTDQWEQSAAYIIDHHATVDSFVKNAGLRFAIPYLDNGEAHDYEPDFIFRLVSSDTEHLILETKGYDKKAEIKAQAAERWVSAVNAAKSLGRWRYKIARSVGQVRTILDGISSVQSA